MVKTNMETVLEVKNLAKDYESFSLNDVSFNVWKHYEKRQKDLQNLKQKINNLRRANIAHIPQI